MAGVIQEIDLVLAEATVAAATKDAAQAGERIGRAISEAPAVKAAARQLGAAIATELSPDKAQAAAVRYMDRLSQQFQLSRADISERLARGLLSPEQARKAGEDAARQFNVGVLSQIKTLGEAGALGGGKGQALYLDLAGSLKNVATEGTKSTAVLSGLRGAMFSLAASASGVPGPLGRIAGLLLSFSGGAGIAIAVAAAIGLIALAYDKLTSKAREAAKATTEWIASQVEAAKQRAAREEPEAFAAAGFQQAEQEAERVAARIAQLRARGVGGVPVLADVEEVRELEARLVDLGVAWNEVGRRRAEALDARPLSREEQAIEREVAALSKLLEVGKANAHEQGRAVALLGQARVELALLNASGKTDEETQKRRITLIERIATLTAQGTKRAEEAARERDRLTKESERAAEQARKEEARAAEEALRHQEQLAKQRADLAQELRGQLAQLTTTAVDDLELALHELQVRIIGTFGAVPAEVQPLLTAMREEIRNVKFLEPIDKEIEALKPKVAAAGEAITQGLGAPAIALQPVFDALLTKLSAQRDSLDRNSAAWKIINDRMTEVLALQGSLVEGVGDANVTLDGTAAKTTDWADAMGRVGLGATELLDALGLVDDQLSSILRGTAELASNLPKALAGLKSGGKLDIGSIVGVLGGAGAILGGIGGALGIGESAEEKERKAINRANTEAIVRLTRSIGELDLDIKGSTFAGLGRAFATITDPSRFALQGGRVGGRGLGDRVGDVLQREGLSVEDLQEAAAQLGLTFQNTEQFYRDFAEALKEVSLTDFTRTLEGQLNLFQRFAEQAGLTATETLRGIVQRASGTSVAFDRIFAGLDTSTKEGLEEAKRRLTQALQDLPILTAEELGGLSVEQYLELIGQAGDLITQGIEDLGQAVADAAAEAADRMRDRIEQSRQVLELADRTAPLEVIQATARSGPAQLREALQGLDLGREADRARLDRRIQELFAKTTQGAFTAEALGGMDPEDFKALLLEWERLLDEQRQVAEDDLRSAEEGQVAAREQREAAKAFAELQQRATRVGGPAREAVEEAARLLAEALRAERGPLGVESPLAQDARRRAEQALSEAERLVSEGERLRGGGVEPGFTVQRTITEASAGRVIGELVTSNVWLEKIFHQGERLGGAGAAPGGSASVLVPIIVELDGRTIAEVVSQQQFQQFQTRAGLNGAAGLPG